MTTAYKGVHYGAALAAQRLVGTSMALEDIEKTIHEAYAEASSKASLPRIGNPQDVAAYFQTITHGLTDERLYVLAVDSRRKALDSMHIQGWTDGVTCDARVVFKWALNVPGCSAILLAHNHPSGDPTPSEADKKMTRRMATVAEAMNMPLLDHVVVASNGYASIAALGLCG